MTPTADVYVNLTTILIQIWCQVFGYLVTSFLCSSLRRIFSSISCSRWRFFSSISASFLAFSSYSASSRSRFSRATRSSSSRSVITCHHMPITTRQNKSGEICMLDTVYKHCWKDSYDNMQFGVKFP